MLEGSLLLWSLALFCDVLAFRSRPSWFKYGHLFVLLGTFFAWAAYLSLPEAPLNQIENPLGLPSYPHLVKMSTLFASLCSLFRLFTWKTGFLLPESVYWLSTLVLIASASWALDISFIK